MLASASSWGCGLDLRATADVDSSAGANADVDRRRWWRGWKIPRQRRIVGRRWDIAVDRVGNVGAPAHGNTPADACAHVGVGHTSGHNGIRRDDAHRYPGGDP